MNTHPNYFSGLSDLDLEPGQRQVKARGEGRPRLSARMRERGKAAGNILFGGRRALVSLALRLRRKRKAEGK